MFGRKNIKKWLLVTIAIETLCATYFLKIYNYTAVTSVIYFLAGIAIACMCLMLPAAKPIGIQRIGLRNVFNWVKPILAVLIILTAYFVSRYWFMQIPIDIDYADMLPVIRIMDQRFVNGHWNHVYDTIPEIWGGIKPVYLPAMWLPYSLAELFQFDMRWITVAGVLLSFMAFLIVLDFRKNKVVSCILLLIAAVLFWWLFAEDDAHGLISMSEEGVVIFYYVLLTFAIISGNSIAMAVASSLCMLSRYAVIGWLPAVVLHLFLDRREKDVMKLVVTGFVCLLTFFILPFGLKSLLDLSRLPGNYIGFAQIVWRDSREVYWLSLGFAKFFGPGKTSLLHALLVTLTFVIPIAFVILCHFIKKQTAISNIPLATLKISLLVFYNFIDVPYLYLFYTSSFVSLITVAHLMRTSSPATAAL